MISKDKSLWKSLERCIKDLIMTNLLKDCDDHTADMMISYNSSQLIKSRFKNWNAVEFDLTYTMRSVGDYMSDQQTRKELLLLNYGTQGMVEVDQFVKEESY